MIKQLLDIPIEIYLIVLLPNVCFPCSYHEGSQSCSQSNDHFHQDYLPVLEFLTPCITTLHSMFTQSNSRVGYQGIFYEPCLGVLSIVKLYHKEPTIFANTNSNLITKVYNAHNLIRNEDAKSIGIIGYCKHSTAINNISFLSTVTD